MNEIGRAGDRPIFRLRLAILLAESHNLITAFMDLSFAAAACRCHAYGTMTNRTCQPSDWEGTVDNQEVGRLKSCSETEFAYWGMKDFAYIRPVLVDGKAAMAVYAANGTQLAVMDTLAAAQVTVLQNDMEPLSVH